MTCIDYGTGSFAPYVQSISPVDVLTLDLLVLVRKVVVPAAPDLGVPTHRNPVPSNALVRLAPHFPFLAV